MYVAVPAAEALFGSARLAVNVLLAVFPQPPLGVDAAKFPANDPTLTAVPAATAGRPLETTNIPSPLASVVNVPTTVVPTVTLSDVLTVAPVTLIDNDEVVVPHIVLVVYVTVPAAVALLGSASVAVNVICCEAE